MDFLANAVSALSGLEMSNAVQWIVLAIFVSTLGLLACAFLPFGDAGDDKIYELWLDDGFVPLLAQADSDEVRKGNVVGVGGGHVADSFSSVLGEDILK